MNRWDDVLLWLLSLMGSFALCGARLGHFLFRLSDLPPVEPLALEMWQRKRRWLVISELSALPAFATISIVVGRLREWPLEGVILFSMVLGAIGFAMFLDGLQTVIRARLGIARKDDHG